MRYTEMRCYCPN